MQDIVGSSALDTFFGPGIMSVHYKEGVALRKKVGKPGDWSTTVEKDVWDKQRLLALVDTLLAEVDLSDNNFLEIDKQYSKVLQLGPYRVVIVLPPLSDGVELTVVKPVKKLSLEDYKIDDKLREQLFSHAKGILIAGSPGSGKTTFAQALAEAHMEGAKIVKTIESPRDLMVSDEIVQYSFSYGSHDEIRDILLLSRPDYTVYDEVRNKQDFVLYKDLRLTGIGLLGVIHATRPVDAIQRFIGTIEMGIIPQVIDTVVYIDAGEIADVYSLNLVVKVPAGMLSEDLARPVVQISSFASEKVLYEIYTFGEQVVVMPTDSVPSTSEKPIQRFAREGLYEYFEDRLQFDCVLDVKTSGTITLYVPSKKKGYVVGKGGDTVRAIEQELGARIVVKSFDEMPLVSYKVHTEMKRKQFYIQFPAEQAGKPCTLVIKNSVIHTIADEKAQVRITQNTLIKKIQKYGFVIADVYE